MYLKGIIQQILVSYQTLTELKDAQNDLENMKKEISKINGLFLVIKNKLEKEKNQSDRLKNLRTLIIDSLNDKKIIENLQLLLKKL